MPQFDLYKTLTQTGDSLKQLSVFNPLTIHKKGTRSKAVFALALVCILWGTTWLASKEDLWIRDCYACADERYRMNIRVINEKPWGNLFAANMFLRPVEEELDSFTPEWTILCAPDLKLDPAACGTRRGTEALLTEEQQNCLGLESREPDIGCIRQPGLDRTVHARLGNISQNG